jgi:hypothetical protein
MPLAIVPKKPKPITLFRFMPKAIRHIESITLTALSCSPTNSWSVTLLANIVATMRNGADELERAIELRRAEDRALHHENLAALRQREAESKDGRNA